MSRSHEVLGVEPGATPAEVSAAFRRFALQNHPDRGGDPEHFRAGVDAYRCLLAAAGRSVPRRSGADVVFHRRARPGVGSLVRRARLVLTARSRP